MLQSMQEYIQIMIKKIKLGKIIDYALILLVIIAGSVALKNYKTINKLIQANEYAKTLAVGDTLPSITCADTSGTSSIELVGSNKVRVIICFGICPACFKEIAIWNSIYHALKEKQSNIQVIGLFIDHAGKLVQFTDRQPVDFSVYICLKTEYANDLRVRRIPQIYIVENDTITGVYTNPTEKKIDMKEILGIIQLTEQDLEEAREHIR